MIKRGWLRLYKHIEENWSSILIVLMLVGNAITKIVVDRKRENEFFNLLGIEIHLSTLIMLVVYVVIFVQFIQLKNDFKYFTSILAIFFIGVLINIESIDKQDLAGRFFFVSKFSFIFMIVPVFRNIEIHKIIHAENILIIFGKFNLILMVIGLSFGIEIFKSYPYSERFGYNGLILLQGMGGFLYNLLIIKSYFEFIKNERRYFDLIVFILAGLMTGTKVVYLLLILLFIFNILYVVKTYWVKWTTITIILVSLFFLKPIIGVISKFFPFGESLSSNYGYITFLTSKRDLNLQQVWHHVETKWTFVDYLFGNINPKLFIVESSLPDLFFFFGISGLAVFVVFFVNQFFSKTTDNQLKWILGIFLIVSTLAGGFFYSVFNVISFSCMVVYLIRRYNQS